MSLQKELNTKLSKKYLGLKLSFKQPLLLQLLSTHSLASETRLGVKLEDKERTSMSSILRVFIVPFKSLFAAFIADIYISQHPRRSS